MIRMKTLLIGALAALTGAAPLRLQAAFESYSGGARPAAMSHAYTAVADDANALLYNPAGLWQPLKPEITAHYARLLTGLDDGSVISQTFMGWAQPWEKVRGGLGAAYADLTLSSLYSEKSFLLGYSQTLMNRKLSLGAAAKALRVTVGEDLFTNNALDTRGNAQVGVADPVLASRRSRTAYTFDAGLLYKPIPKASFGLSLQNATRPDVGLLEENRLPMATRVGAALHSRKGLAAMDIVQKRALQGVTDTIFSMGFEKPFEIGSSHTLLARAGAMNGSRQLRQISFGFGWRGTGFSFDYSLLLPMAGLESGNNTHRASLSYRFHWPLRGKTKKPDALPKKTVSKEKPQQYRALIQQARRLVEEGKYKEALFALSRVLELDPTNSKALRLLEKISFRLKTIKEE